MTHFIIIETDNGQTIVSCEEGDEPEAVAEASKGVLVDEGPFASYEVALDALADLEPDEEQR